MAGHINEFSAKFHGQKRLLYIANSVVMYEAQLTFKPNSFLLVNAANLQLSVSQLETVVKSAWGNLSSSCKIHTDSN